MISWMDNHALASNLILIAVMVSGAALVVYAVTATAKARSSNKDVKFAPIEYGVGFLMAAFAVMLAVVVPVSVQLGDLHEDQRSAAIAEKYGVKYVSGGLPAGREARDNGVAIVVNVRGENQSCLYRVVKGTDPVITCGVELELRTQH